MTNSEMAEVSIEMLPEDGGGAYDGGEGPLGAIIMVGLSEHPLLVTQREAEHWPHAYCFVPYILKADGIWHRPDGFDDALTFRGKQWKRMFKAEGT